MQYPQTRYSDTINPGISDVALSLTAGLTPPTRTQGILTIGRLQSNTEDVYYTGVAGNIVTIALRGLSQTALTLTNVIGNQKIHLANESLEMTTHHNYDTDLLRKSENDIVTGVITFQNGIKITVILDVNGNEVISMPATIAAVNYLEIDNSATGQKVILKATGDDANVNLEIQGKGTGNLTIPDGSLTKTAAAPTDLNGIANKQYVDSAVANFFGGNGSDGALNIVSGTTTLNLGQLYQFTSINIAGGATLAFTGTGAVMIKNQGAFTGTGTIELRNSSNIAAIPIATQYGIITGGNGQVVAAPNVGGVGGVGADGGAGVIGGNGGTSTTAGGGGGGGGGTVNTNGGNGSGGGSVTGGGGGGGSGGGFGGGSGVAGLTTVTIDGGAGGAGASAVNNQVVGGGGGGGGGLNTGNGGNGGDAGAHTGTSGMSQVFGGAGGIGGASGATGGNGGNGGNGESLTSNASPGGGLVMRSGVGGVGGWGYSNGGVGGDGGSFNTNTDNQAESGAGGNGGDSTFGTGGNGGNGGLLTYTGTLAIMRPAGAGGNGGNGRTPGVGGNGGAYVGPSSTYFGRGGHGGVGGDAKNGCPAFVMYVAGNSTFTGTINAQGVNGGAGGVGGASNHGIGGNGGNGGNASRGSDVMILALGTVASITINNTSGIGGVGGVAGTGVTGASTLSPGTIGTNGLSAAASYAIVQKVLV